MPVESSASRTGDSLTPLRGVAAVCVTAFHVCDAVGALKSQWSGLWLCLEGAYLWVDFFFILSGFVIVMVYGGEVSGESSTYRTRCSFLVKRFVRIWPLHVATLFALVFFDLLVSVLGRSGAGAFSLPSRSIASIPANLLLVHSLGVCDGFSWNVPSWSISCEWGAYVLYSFMGRFLPALQHGSARLALTFCFLLYSLFCLWYGGLTATTDFGLFRCLLGFLTGACVYRFRQGGAASDAGSDAGSSVVYLGTLLVLAAGFFCARWAKFDALAIPGFALAVFVMHQPRASVRLWTLESPIFRFLGEISYSIYLVHWLLIASVPAALDRVFGYDVRAGVGSGLAGVLIMIGTIIVSTFTYHWIECPPRRWVKAWLLN